MLIAERAGGDMRSGMNDLQAAAQGQTTLKLEDVATAERDVKSSIFKVLEVIFKGNSAQEALQASYALDESPEDLINWVDENLPLAYQGEDLWQGYESLARADVFLGRVRSRQNYGLWRYAGFLMTGGVQAAKAAAQARLRGLPAAQPLAQHGPDQKGAQRSGLGGQEDRQALPRLCGFRPGGADGLRGAASERQEEGALWRRSWSWRRRRSRFFGQHPTTKKVQSIFEEAQKLKMQAQAQEIDLAWRGQPTSMKAKQAGSETADVTAM